MAKKAKTEVKTEVKAVEPKPEVKPTWADFDKTEYVNIAKAERAFKAVYGGAKPGTAEVQLANKFRKELKGDELVKAVYKGLAGLIDPVKAGKNRENEERDRKARASR